MKLYLLNASRLWNKECVQALEMLREMAKRGHMDGVMIMWWPVGGKGHLSRVEWVLAGRVHRNRNDAYAGAGRLMKALIDSEE